MDCCKASAKSVGHVTEGTGDACMGGTLAPTQLTWLRGARWGDLMPPVAKTMTHSMLASLIVM